MNKLVARNSKWSRISRSSSSVGHVRDSYDYTHLLHFSFSPYSLKQIHAQIIVSGYQHHPYLSTQLVSKYIHLFGHSGLTHASNVFHNLPHRDLFLWTTLLRGYSKYHLFDQVLTCFHQMQTAPDQNTLPLLLKAVNHFNTAQLLHAFIIKSGFDSHLNVSNALLALYAKCHSVSSSIKVYDSMSTKDVVTWNSLISAYVANGLPAWALHLFHLMLLDETVSPDHATLVTLLPACAQQSAVKEGLWIHSRIIRCGFQLDAALGSGLVSMYANTGRLKSAQHVFSQISDKNIVVWSTMIKAYGTHGHADKALDLFFQLLDTGLRPDSIIFLCLLSACSHAGMVSQGSQLFGMMEDYGAEKTPQHYACMIDLYSRAGLINEAVKLIDTMPIQAGTDAYGALLGACRIYNNIELAEKVATKLFELDPENPGRYLILVKMYEDAGRYEDAARLRKALREKNIRRPIGYSEIEVDYNLHRFGVDVESHPLKEQIVETLRKLKLVMDDEEMTVDNQNGLGARLVHGGFRVMLAS